MKVENVLLTFMVGFAFSLALSIAASIKASKGKNEDAGSFSIAVIIVNAAFLCAGAYLLWYKASCN